MTNLDQHSTFYGTNFGVMGSLEGLFNKAQTARLSLVATGSSNNTVSARRLRRRNRQLRMH